MTKFTRTIKTTSYTCRVYNHNTDSLETAVFIAEGDVLKGRALAKAIESSSTFKDTGLQYLSLVDTRTVESKYECTLDEFLSVAHKVENKSTKA